MPAAAHFLSVPLPLYLFLPQVITITPGLGDFPRRRGDDNYDVEGYGEATTVFRGLEELSPRVIKTGEDEKYGENVERGKNKMDFFLSLVSVKLLSRFVLSSSPKI